MDGERCGTLVVRIETGDVFQSIAAASRAAKVKYWELYRAVERGTACAGTHWDRIDPDRGGPGPWRQIDRRILDLLRDVSDSEGKALISVSDMARRLECGEKSVSRSLRTLCAEGAIERGVRFDERGGQLCNWYRVIPSREVPCDAGDDGWRCER